MEVKLVWNQRMGFTGQGPSGHRVMMDADASVGGDHQGARPTELLLMALGGCTGMDVVSILRKMGLAFTDVSVRVEGTQAADHPRVFEHFEVVYRVKGKDLARSKVERAVQLSLERYCPVARTLAGRATIDHRVELVE